MGDKRKLHRSGSQSNQKKPALDPVVIGDLIISNIVTPLDLDPVDQDFVNGELKWLFSAVDNLFKLCQKLGREGGIDFNQPIAVPIPPEAETTSPEANNQLLRNPKSLMYNESFEEMLGRYNPARDRYDGGWGGKIESNLKQINTYLSDLEVLLKQEAGHGEAGRYDPLLQDAVKSEQISIIKILQNIAQTMDEAYGIRITTPDQLMSFLEEFGGLQKPTALGEFIISSVIPTFELAAEDQEWVNGEIAWLFSAVDNFLKLRQKMIEVDHPISVSIPSQAQQTPQANNQLLLDNIENMGGDTLEENTELTLAAWQGKIEGAIKNSQIRLQQLNILLEREAQLGEAGKYNVSLQDRIKGHRSGIVEYLQTMAEIMNNAYGILVTSPGQLVEFLDGE
jgi:hypothetical protein